MLRLNRNMRPKTPPNATGKRLKGQHYDTPTKAGVAAVLTAFKATNMPFSKTDVYEFHGMDPRVGRNLDKRLREAREEEEKIRQRTKRLKKKGHRRGERGRNLLWLGGRCTWGT